LARQQFLSSSALAAAARLRQPRHSRPAAAMASNAMIGGSGFVTQPPDEMPMASQSTLLLQKKKEMAEVQQQLDRKKEEFRARMQRCQEQEVLLASKQEDIKEQVRKFDKFLKDNDAKRVRADRKVQEEKKSREQKESERLKLFEDARATDERRQQLKFEVEAKGKFQRFLDLVCEELPEYFEGIENIMLRYETLAAAHQDLGERVTSAQIQHEENTNQLMGYVKQRTNDLLVYNSEIAQKQKSCDQNRLKIQDWEETLSGRYNASKEGTRQLGEIKMAIENIYGRCSQRRVRAAGEQRDLQSFLEFIRLKITDLQSITSGYRAPTADAKPSGDPAARRSDGAKASVTNAGGASPGADKGSLRASAVRGAADGTHGSQSMSGSAAGLSTTSVGGGPTSKTIALT